MRQKLRDLAGLGQSIWYDNIRRAMLDSGELAGLVDAGVIGVTSNPSIFEKAIAGSADYDEAIGRLDADLPAQEVFERLAVEDIRRAADILRPTYDRTDRLDGYVSLEVSPHLAHDTDGTVAEARRLWKALDRPNVMIKVPATPEGVPAIRTLIADGINVNVTLIFALTSYEAVAEAYLAGLEARAEDGRPLAGVASVASFFVSRVDVAVDEALAKTDDDELAGTIAISNAKLAYARAAVLFDGPRWEALADAGARPQRLLWASTSTKDPAYPDTLYVDELIGDGTVNTVPPATLDAFLDHGTVAATLGEDIDVARQRIARLDEIGVDFAAITGRLQAEGVKAFADSFDALLEAVDDKRQRLRRGADRIASHLGAHADTVEAALETLRDEDVIRRIWRHDHTVWRPDPAEISNRLGWLHAPEVMEGCVPRLERLRDELREEGTRHVVLMGMGGSSLAPEAFHEIFGPPAGGDGLELRVIDGTDPAFLRDRAGDLDPATTLYIVASKSGGTVETLSAFKHLYNGARRRLGPENVGRRFVAITDPDSGLAKLAAELGLRETFLNDPTVGGRYSALTWFGLVPAALVGVDVPLLLERARTAACNAAAANCPVAGDNDAARLGATLGELAGRGRDKLTIVTSPGIESFGDWIEQLVAESTGKDGKGILPVVREPLGSPDVYGEDRLFVEIAVEGEDEGARDRDAAFEALEEAGHPVLRLRLRDRHDLGAWIFTWEMATAIAGRQMGIHPFDQPNVEAAKVQAGEMVARFEETGSLPEDEAGTASPDDFAAALGDLEPGAYVAIQVYAAPTPATDAAIRDLRVRMRDARRVATTGAYGPRFLHSTGQLHKGDAGHGLFVQVVSRPEADIPIPDTPGEEGSSIGFQVLKEAQALGDARALREAGRRVLRFETGPDAAPALERLRDAVS
ncbi:MAG: bifunctional transaldolase/phosoglucose isomerase [Gemmatimonadota bacterium]|nr:bifunctional transaldolase/phosoglucose isomerase [Gemmatimonadota bacterium]